MPTPSARQIITTIMMLLLVLATPYGVDQTLEDNKANYQSILEEALNNLVTYQTTMETQVKKALYEGFEPHYHINDCQINFTDLQITGPQVQAELLATLNTTLKATTVEEMPHFMGMLRRLHMNHFSYESPAQTRKLVAQANAGLSSEQVNRAAATLDFWFNELHDLYFGQPSDCNYSLRVSANISEGQLDPDSIVILAEAIEDYIPLADLLPRSKTQLEQDGFDTMQAIIENK